MIQSRELFEGDKMSITLQRLTYQLLERYPAVEETRFIGIQPRGVYLANRIKLLLEAAVPNKKLLFGMLDVSFHRDDFQRRETTVVPRKTDVDFFYEDKNVVLIDDVLYTGRTIRAAMDAMLQYGRPSKVELLVLVDRHYKRHLPISPDYVGVKVNTTDNEAVMVEWAGINGKSRDSVRIQTKTIA